jgi:hypothetical protein
MGNKRLIYVASGLHLARVLLDTAILVPYRGTAH